MTSSSALPIALGITGASGAPYWVRFVEVVVAAGRQVHIAASTQVDTVCRTELGVSFEKALEQAEARGRELAAAALDTDPDRVPGSTHLFDARDWYCPMASGSAKYAGMVVLPCSMGTLARIATGASDDLISRAADVALKERRKLVLVPRETPLNLVHLENMAAVTRAGAVVLPAMPGFYHRPSRIEDLVDFIVQRITDQLGLDVQLTRRWGGQTLDT